MARLRHPAIVQFLGVCSLPACILTGEAGGLRRATSCFAAQPSCGMQPTAPGGLPPPCAAQSSARAARCTTC